MNKIKWHRYCNVYKRETLKTGTKLMTNERKNSTDNQKSLSQGLSLLTSPLNSTSTKKLGGFAALCKQATKLSFWAQEGGGNIGAFINFNTHKRVNDNTKGKGLVRMSLVILVSAFAAIMSFSSVQTVNAEAQPAIYMQDEIMQEMMDNQPQALATFLNSITVGE